MLLELVSDLLAQAGDRGYAVEGVGIGLPGIVDSRVERCARASIGSRS